MKNKNNLYSCLALLISLGIGLSSNQPAACADSSKAPEKKNTAVETEKQHQEESVRSVLIALQSALSNKDAQKAAELWSEDANFIDETGEETHGRKALQERFESGFKKRTTENTIEIHPSRISLPADNVAMVAGEVSRKVGDINMPTTRFSMVLLKSGSTWLISEANESPLSSISSGEHLKELNWLIGNWNVDTKEGTAKLNVDWAPGKNFILAKFGIRKKDSPEQIDSQVIGWDPRTNNIVSWHFDSDGGFAYGKWSKQADTWTVEVAGVTANGGSSRASNVFTVKSPSEFVWQSIDRFANGTQVDNTEQLKVLKAAP